MRRKITEFHRPRGFEKAQARARDHISVKCTCTRLQWRKSASLEAEILVFRHQLNVLTASSAIARGFSPAQWQGFFVIFSTV
jgi:hypothetical protein